MTSVTKLHPGFKDGDDGSDSSVESFNIEIVHNGFILTSTYEDGTEVKEVFHDFDRMVKEMRKEL